jgi:RNA polymerase sigma factor (sigma-70 family)
MSPRTHAAVSVHDEEGLFQRAAAGDTSAEQELVRRHLPLVRSIARKYRTPGAEMEDLVQEGATGLVRAIRKFEPGRGFRFSTYAHWWIRQAISRFVKGPTRLIRLPEYVHDDISRLHRTRESTLIETGRAPSEKELEHDLHWTAGKVGWLDQLSSDAASLDAKVKDGAGLEVADAITNEGSRDPLSEAERNQAWGRVLAGFRGLPRRQAQILAYRFGFADGEPRSLTWVGERVGLSPERVRQLQMRALETLRRSAEAPAKAA